MLWFRFLILVFIVTSCATKKTTPKLPVLTKDDCSNGSVLKCFEEGIYAREKKDFVLARDFFKKGCLLNHPFSCSELGMMERALGDMKNYHQLQDQACESMDAIACYNLACSFCLKNNQSKTMESLKKASSLGYYNSEGAATDPDLKCVEKNPEFKKWLTDISKRKETSFPISYDFSYLKGMDLSLRFPPTLMVTRSFPTLFVYHEKAQISVYLSPDSYQVCLKKMKDALKDKLQVTELKELDIVRNGLPAHIVRLNFESERKNLTEILYITGTAKRCWVLDGVAEANTDTKTLEEIDLTVTSLVVKPFNQSTDKDLSLYFQGQEMKYAGLSTAGQGAGFYTYYSPDGMWRSPINATSFYLGYFVSPKLEDDRLYRQKLGDVALKIVPHGFIFSEFLESSTKLVDGKLAIFYKSRAKSKNKSVIVTTVFYQKENSKLPILLVHFQPVGTKEIINWENTLKRIVLK